MKLANIESGARDAAELSTSATKNHTNEVVGRASYNIWSKIIRRSEKCDPDDPCGRPMSANATTLAIALGVVIPLVTLAVVLIFLHRRNVRKVRQEDAKHEDLNLDFGLDEAPKAGKGGKRKSMFGGGEKNLHRPGQLSMDMNLSSPYLLPANMIQSKESLHSMARGFHNEQDPYHTVALYSGGGDGASVRSMKKDGLPPNFNAKSSLRQSPPQIKPPPRTNSMPKSPTSPGEKSDPFATPTIPKPVHQLSEGEISDFHLPVQPIVPEIGSVYPEDNYHQNHLDMPDVQAPPPVLAKDAHFELPNPQEQHGRFELSELPEQHAEIAAYDHHHQHAMEPTQPVELGTPGLGLDFNLSDNMPLPPPPADNHELPSHPDDMHHPDDMNNAHYAEYDSYPQIQTTEYYEDIPHNPHLAYEDEHDYHPVQQEGLGVPVATSKRMSVGFRPLPPDEINESEDPEYRANRIRSFYKEYFEDSAGAPPPPMPGQEYYEDYSPEYMGDGAYYDADSNAFVMPYAQPVTRRAMTPPPGGRRGPPMGGHRGPHNGTRGPGSVGGMSAPGGRGRPRAGSAFAGRGPPKKKLPPPQALHTLPTPSKLTDDSFAIFNATDFAPPDSFKEAAAGRSQSPFGERRPYKQTMPAASPLVTAFDELSALPSPHMLRKSNTFTGLDFAPPKKFKDGDNNASDAGSIRSNRSGISPKHLGAIRAGAGRVSRLPGDTVFTAVSMGDQLKPQWGMRQ